MREWHDDKVYLASVGERLQRRVVLDENGCWNWQGALWNGYGRVNVGSRANGTRQSTSAHRTSYIVFVGLIPNDKEICHRCDNRRCINPDHLFVGTRKDNMQDCLAKGRFVFAPRVSGVHHHNAKLTLEQVRAIRASRLPSTKVASEFGISDGHFRAIRRGAHFPDPPEAT
jgi:hypothetical protein